jgi:hypothetical protein
MIVLFLDREIKRYQMDIGIMIMLKNIIAVDIFGDKI